MANRVQLEAILKFVGVQVNPGIFNQISRAAAGMPGPVQQFNRNLQQSVGIANNVNRSVQGVKNQLTGSERAARLFLQRMAQFAILLPTFATLNKSIQGGVKFLFEFDAAIKDIIRVDIGKLSGKFDDIAERAFKLSDAFGTSALDAVNTIKLYTQAGFDLEKATELARLSLLATKASTLDAAGATEFLLSATKQFRLEGKDLERALDSLVAAEDLSALEARDIADAFRTGGNSLAQFGKDINDGIGLISALREQTRKSGNEIGTFFKTLQTRIFAAGESRAAIEALGVSVQNLDGSLRPTLDVLNDLKVAFDGMTEAQVANASKAIAGVRQFESLTATIQSLDRANELSEASSHSAGAARRKEEVDSQKLSRRLDELVVAGQKLAYALGEAGSTDFFKGTLETATALIKILTKVVKLLDTLKIPVLPILAPLAVKAAGQVFGLGGNQGGGGAGPQNAGMQQLGAASAQLAQQFRVLSIATSTQTQAQKVNAAATAAQAAASNLQTVALKQSIAAHQQASTVYGRAVGVYKSSVGSIQSSGARLAVQYTLLTVGVSTVTSVLNNLSSALGDQNFGGVLSSVTSNGVQLAGQFAILGPMAAGVAGSFGVLSSILSKYIDTAEENQKAFQFEADENAKTRRFTDVPKFFKGEDNLQGKMFLQDYGKAINQRTKDQINLDKALSEGYKSLEGPARTQIQSFAELKELFNRPELAKRFLATLIRIEDPIFKNRDALEELRSKLDENGKTTISYKAVIDLFHKSLGMLATEADRASDGTEKIIRTFAQLKDLQELIGAAQDVNELQRQIDLAQKAPEAMVRGIDLLSVEAQNSAQELEAASLAFDRFNESIKNVGAGAFTNMEDANKFMKDLNAMMSTPGSKVDIDKYLSSSKLTDEQVAFGKEYVKIHDDMKNATLKAAQGEQAYKDEIYKRNEQTLKAQNEAAITAADALTRFQNSLLKVGTTANDTGMIGQISQLTSADVEKALAGKSDLPQAIQDVITSTFVDGVKRAEQNLSKVADETANSLQPIQLRLSQLAEEIIKLGDPAANTEDAFKKEAIEREIAAKNLELQTTEQDGYIKSLEALRALTTETKKAQEDAARAEADRLKKTQALTNATHEFSKAIKDVNRSFAEFVKGRVEDAAQKQASAYEEVKTAEQGVLSATEGVANAYRDYIATVIQVNGVIAEAKVRANLLGRDIGMLNGGIVTFQDRLTSLNDSFMDVLDDANMSLEQRIQLETQLAEQTLSFLRQAQDEIVGAGLGVFGQSAQENQGLQKGIDGLAFIAEKLGGSFQNFLGMDPQQIDQLSQELLNLPVEFRQSVLDALSFLPSTTSIGGFSVEQLKQAIGQVGAGVSPEAGLPAISELASQQVEQLKILGQLGVEDAKLQLSQVVAAYKALEKAQEQLDVAKIQEERAREGFERVNAAIVAEMNVIATGDLVRRELLRQIVVAGNANTLHSIENQAQLFADQNSVFREVGDSIVQGVSQAINARISQLEAQQSLNNFNQMQSFENQAKGYIPNFAHGNLSPKEAAGLLHAASREKKMMPNGAQLAVANTKEAIIPMYQNFAGGNSEGSAIAASINSIRTLDQTMVAAIAASVSNTLSKITTDSGNEASLDKIAGLLSDLNTSLNQVRDSNLAIKTNTTGLATPTAQRTPGGAAATTAGQEVRIVLQTNQNNTVQITGLENLRDQLRQALAETTSKQTAEQLEVLMTQLDPIFQALNERGMISSFGQSR